MSVSELIQKYEKMLERINGSRMFMSMNEDFGVQAEVKVLEEIIRDLKSLV
jgi:hypothetical protein